LPHWLLIVEVGGRKLRFLVPPKPVSHIRKRSSALLGGDPRGVSQWHPACRLRRQRGSARIRAANVRHSAITETRFAPPLLAPAVCDRRIGLTGMLLCCTLVVLNHQKGLA
jgi:hypothetical protein